MLISCASQTEAYDDDGADGDSALGSDRDTAFTGSVTSSIFDYQYENGRRYHAYREGQYVLPNDSQEQERLDLQHHIWRLLLGGHLYAAPLPSPETKPSLRILDLGTGTGIWAIDMADEFPSADVAGVDLSPIQPEWVPNNCRFHVDDYEDQWTYREDEKFDYIHGRALSGTSANWARFYQQVMENLVPGGLLEMQEYDAWIFSDDDSCDRAPWTMEWVNKLDAASKMYGKQINVAKHHKQWMIDAGFEDVQEVVKRVRCWTLFFCGTSRTTVPLLSIVLDADRCVRDRYPSGRGPKTLPSKSSADSSSSTCKCRSTRTRRRCLRGC